MATRWALTVGGTVQGVGFRPFVLRLARQHGLTGWVANRTDAVYIEIQGSQESTSGFLAGLRSQVPPLCRVDSVQLEELPLVEGETGIEIRQSLSDLGRGGAMIPPDTSTCAACLRDTLDPDDRHYLYPFTNCTECGPRFSIVTSLPYDRPRTTMAGFGMCERCSDEYHSPADRRFHAQPVACPACGPRMSLLDAGGTSLAPREEGDDAAIRAAARMLSDGLILAIKGIGGFHLACDASDEATVRELRRRKQRACKPLAVMCRDMATAEQVCEIGPQAAGWLTGPRAPVVLLRRRSPSEVMARSVAKSVAPGLDRLGVLLPYTPLHMLLMRHSPPILVMTSGNLTGLPLVTDNDRALTDLSGVADGFLVHDRPIANRCDDSVIFDMGGMSLLSRRSRGFVPEPIGIGSAAGWDTVWSETSRQGDRKPAILGVGGDQRSAACLLSGTRAVFSQHIGDLTTVEGESFLIGAVRTLVDLCGTSPAILACDMHPGYRSRGLAALLAQEYHAQVFAVQHHHAHFASCLAATGHRGQAVGVILDGTGYGEDGQIRGFEVIAGDVRLVHRHIHLQAVPLPGGDWAVRNPMASAAAYLIAALGERGVAPTRALFGREMPETELLADLLMKPSGRGTSPVPQVSSCGRLFDAVAAITGVCKSNTYDGQAPSELCSLVRTQYRADIEEPGAYPFEIRGGEIGVAGVIRELLDDVMDGRPPEYVALRFHRTVVSMVVSAVMRVTAATGLTAVALGGGCWQNEYLLTKVTRALNAEGLAVLVPDKVPVNDGGLALGQVVVAAASLAGCGPRDSVPFAP